MVVGIAVDHAGFELKEPIVKALRAWGYEVKDFGAYEFEPGDDFPDYVIPLCRAVSSGEVCRGVAVCGSGVGACIAANKVEGVAAGLISDTYSAHQGVEDDRMNVICLGARILGRELAKEIAGAFLRAQFDGHERHIRRIGKITKLDGGRG
ncbi:MAG: RpiB/LacA/LacB family sugar-phosphate isomerase [Fibrobacter sp.]|nr:RpiB/LacA/LacB family sugar-phosphate isomerase [Fibrobacter sp.]